LEVGQRVVGIARDAVGMWDTEVTRVIGALISVGGVGVASPPATQHAGEILRANAQQGRATVARALRRVLRLEPKNIHLHVHDVLQAQSLSSATVAIRVDGAGIANPTIEDRVRLLEQHLRLVNESIASLQQQASERDAAHQQALSALREELVSSISALTARLDASEDRAMQTDARALFIAVLGILLLNFAAEVARLPLVPWLLVILASVALSIGLGRAAWRAGTPVSHG
jgi:hypothetical protein